MSATLSELFPHLTAKEKDDSISLRSIISKYLYHWPLFLSGLLLAALLIYVYMQIANPVYEVKSTILIKDKMKTSEDKSTLQELDINPAPKLAESEMEVLKSRELINKVVKELQLWVIYQEKDGLRKGSLYKKSPVVFRLLDSTGTLSGQTFNIKIKDENSYYLRKSDGSLREIHFTGVLTNSFGSWKLEPTINLKKFIGKEFSITLNDPIAVAQEYQKGIEAVLINKNSPAIGLTVKDNVPQRGKDVLNDLMVNYNKNSIAEKNRVTQATLEFINKRIDSIAGELNTSEKALENYRSSKGVTNISLQSQAYLDNIRDNDKQLNEVNVRLNVIDNIEKSLSSSQNIQNASASLGENYPALNALLDKLSQVQLQRNKLLASVPENNPIYEPLDKQIKGAKADIKEIIQNIKTSLLAAKEKLQSFNSKFESSIHDIPGQERQLIDKTRQKTIKETLYTYLLQKREELSMSYASTLSDAQIVDYAYVDASSSKKSIIGSIALVFGFILPAGFVYLRGTLNNRVITRKEIEAATGAALFGELSHANSSSKLIINEKNDIVVSEEFKALRTNLYFLKDKQNSGMVVLLTSSISNEGKSFISSNLGLALAASNKKTILLEMDLRKPQLMKFLNLRSSYPGISDYLEDRASMEEIIQNSEAHPNLDIISCGPLPEEPSELLEQEKIDVLVSWLKSKYDFIIIDSPPVNLVTDAKILARTADCTLYVIRQAYTFKSLLPFIGSVVQEQKLPRIKFIFNSVEKGRYGYGEYYGNKYYRAIEQKRGFQPRMHFRNFLRRF